MYVAGPIRDTPTKEKRYAALQKTLEAAQFDAAAYTALRDATTFGGALSFDEWKA